MTTTQRKPIGHDLLDRIARAEALDEPGEKLAKLMRDLTRPQPLKDILSGTWLGHPLHPLLIAVPLGNWISAVLVDWLGGPDTEKAADRLVVAGLASALPTVATGYSDWGDSTPGNPSVRRLGLVHAATNATAVALFAGSLVARARGARFRGKLWALGGLGAVGVGGYLGGHLTYAEGLGVNETAFEDRPDDWVDALGDAELGDEQMRKVRVEGVDVLVARHRGTVHVLSNTCCHRGGALDQGEMREGTVICPLHGSTFRLEDGGVEQGPATYPQPAWRSRVRDGRIEVRAPAEPTAD